MIDLKQLKNCILTGQPILSSKDGIEISYTVNYNEKEYTFFFCRKCFSKIQENLKYKRHILRGLIVNNKLSEIENKIIHWDMENSRPAIDGIYLKTEIESAI